MDCSHLRPTGTLTWSTVPKSRPRTYTLTQGTAVVGKLSWQKDWGSLVLGETRTGSWSFKRVGFFNTRVSIRTAGTEQEVAAFHPHLFGGGWAELSGNHMWRLQAKGLFKQTYEFVDHSGRVALTLKPNGDNAEVTFADLSLDERTASLLTLLIWYVALLANEDADTTAVLAAVIS